jgi:hypothetical protein
MRRPPAYFEEVQRKAACRWDQLEQDPELAAPWHQLFKQVQEPSHVVSELLQNADDAGATEASVRVDDDVFVFEHNGEDFRAADFGSLCTFGYSNKRALHTIGFRGIGFKSTFSLGDSVELHTPTLAVRFERRRFTEPVWLEGPDDAAGRTQIRIPLKDARRRTDIERDFERWLGSPISLLFLRNVRRMEIGGRSIHWRSLGPGPIAESERMSLGEAGAVSCLLIRSQPEPFPEDALQEIREERMLADDEGAEFPPCRVEIVLGSERSLFVVLPAGVETELPFACNAPFMQDPARLKIKSPQASPMNRWLLGRVGELAGASMLAWLVRSDLEESERAKAYTLLPEAELDETTLGGLCAAIVQRAVATSVDGQRPLLTEGGEVVAAQQSVVVPAELLDVWPGGQASLLLDEMRRAALSRHVTSADSDKLVRWHLADKIDKDDLLSALQCKDLPRPESWPQLALLWAFIAEDITGVRRRYPGRIHQLRIVPVYGRSVLQSASKAVRLGEKKLLQAEEDWEFLSKCLLVVDHAWLRFLGKARQPAGESTEGDPSEPLNAANAVLREIDLDSASDVNEIINRVAAELSDQDEASLSDWVRLAQIAAKLTVSAGDAFQYVTRDASRRGRNRALFDEDGEVEGLLPEAMQGPLLLHPSYVAHFTSCSRDEWLQWVASGRSGVLSFLPLEQTRHDIFGKERMEKEARRRGYEGDFEYRWLSRRFAIEDWDYDAAAWSHWENLAAVDDRVWERIAGRILQQRDTYWNRAKSARLLQVSARSEAQVHSGPVLPAWAMYLRKVPCLLDSRGFLHCPANLLLLTAETEPFIDVESFVKRSLDTETTRPLLELLGVGSTPPGPDRLLSRLRALAGAQQPPASEVEKWYRRLDLLVATAPTAGMAAIKEAFRSEALILTSANTWASSYGVFLSADEDAVPGAALIRPAVRDLTLWHRIGVAEYPTAELAIEWLRGLATGELSPDDVRRVRALLARHPMRIWTECGHWLNLAGEWVPIAGLRFALTMQSLIPWGHLHPWVKQETADLRRLLADIAGEPPFSDLASLAGKIEERPDVEHLLADRGDTQEWLATVGWMLTRVEFDDEEETERTRAKASILETTRWHWITDLEITPYIDGTPAGTSRRADVVWLADALYVAGIPRAKLAKRVPEEIGKAFGRPDITAALHYSYERSPEDVRAYLEENFALLPDDREVVCDSGEGAVPHPEGHRQLDAIEGQPLMDALDSEAADAPPAGAPGLIASLVVPPTEEVARPESREEPGTDAAGVTVRQQAKPRPVGPSVIERLASAQSFRQDGDGRFLREDGSWIGRTRGDRFPWERRTASGDLVRYYWPVDHCLEREPLEVQADVWKLIEQRPDDYALVLSSVMGGAVELTGARLREMRERGEIALHPATYRIVYDHARGT